MSFIEGKMAALARQGALDVEYGEHSQGWFRRSHLIRELVGLSRGPKPSAEHDEDPGQSPRPISSAIEFDADGDCRYAGEDPLFERVVHIFHQNWHGIRSAAGTLPGHKVVIPSERQLRHAELVRIISQLHDWRVKKAVFHGFSYSANRVLEAASAAGIPCYLVWHGNLAQLVWKPEVKFFELALAACKKGRFQKAHMMKAGMGDIFPRSFEPMLLNRPPVMKQSRLIPAFAGNRTVALVPAFTDIRKNLHSSLVGTALSSSINDVLYYGKIRGVIPAIERCKRIAYGGHEKHLSLLHDIDVTVNVTTIDCHPMVDIEAIGAGAMTLTGPLFLDALEKHPYTRLSVIDNPFNVRGISQRLESLKMMDNNELQDIMTNYNSKLIAISRERYIEFLGL